MQASKNMEIGCTFDIYLIWVPGQLILRHGTQCTGIPYPTMKLIYGISKPIKEINVKVQF